MLRHICKYDNITVFTSNLRCHSYSLLYLVRAHFCHIGKSLSWAVHISRDQIYDVDVGKMPDYARGEGVVDSDDDSEDSDEELGK